MGKDSYGRAHREEELMPTHSSYPPELTQSRRSGPRLGPRLNLPHCARARIERPSTRWARLRFPP